MTRSSQPELEDPASTETRYTEPETPSSENTEATIEARLAPEARSAVVELMRSGAVLARSKPVVYESLVCHRRAIDGHLADMYLRMLVDEPAGVAVLLQHYGDGATDESEDSVTLTNTRVLTLYDTLLALVLRKHYQERQTAGEQQIFIDVEQIESKLSPFLPLTNSDRTERRKLNGALERMKERKLIAAVRGNDERYEITPVIRYVVNAEFLEDLLATYRGLLDDSTP